MLIITGNNASEYPTHTWHAEASELGLRPGHFPTSIKCSLGNKLDLCILELDSHTATYRQTNGCITLTIFND